MLRPQSYSGGLVEQESVQRKLAAILYADVVGYSRLTGADEEGTHRTVSASLDFIAATIEARGGKVIHYAGDAVLAEFASVVVAVECAVEIQREFGERNREVDDEKRLQYRIGVNLGDIIVDRDDIYGDGVNVAARLESLADAGGICVSAKVRAEVGNKHDLAFEDMGAQKVKNIAEPVHAYRVRLTPQSGAGDPAAPGPSSVARRWLAPAALLAVLAIAAALVWFKPWAPSADVALEENMAYPLPDKPSIAVLPFDNLSGDPAQAYFADGISEDIISTLSRISGLFVIARNSTFVYKGKPVKVQQIAEDLGVRYVLEGSVQRDGDQVRITAQLVDALSGNHLWAERYDRKFADLFALQDEITHKIAIALQVELTEGEQFRVWRKTTRSVDVWNRIAKGMEHMVRFVKAGNARARALFEEAAAAEPANAMAQTLIGWTHWMDAQNGWSVSPEQSIAQAFAFAQKASALDENSPDVHALMGALAMLGGDFEAAVAAGEKAVALNPNHATNTALLGMILQNGGRPEEAILRLKTAMRLSPYYPNWFLVELAWSYQQSGQNEEAVRAFRQYLARESGATNQARAYIGLALALSKLGREKEARREIAKAKEVFPRFRPAISPAPRSTTTKPTTTPAPPFCGGWDCRSKPTHPPTGASA